MANKTYERIWAVICLTGPIFQEVTGLFQPIDFTPIYGSDLTTRKPLMIIHEPEGLILRIADRKNLG